MVGSTIVRFRKEIRPVYTKFVIESYICSVNERSLYIIHNFRNDTNATTATTTGNPSRIVAQVIAEGITVQNRKVINPTEFLIDQCQIDVDSIAPLQMKMTDDNNETNSNSFEHDMLQQYISLDQSMRNVASADDTECSNKSR